MILPRDDGVSAHLNTVSDFSLVGSSLAIDRKLNTHGIWSAEIWIFLPEVGRGGRPEFPNLRVPSASARPGRAPAHNCPRHLAPELTDRLSRATRADTGIW